MNLSAFIRASFASSFLTGVTLVAAAEQNPAPDQLLAPQGEQRAAAQAHYVAAHLLESEGRMREALDHYLALLKADPSDSELVTHAADLALSYQGLPEALKLLEDHAAANPASPRAFVILIDFCLTHADQKNELIPKATAYADQALKRFPKDAEICTTAVRLQMAVAQMETDNAKAKAAKDRGISIVEQAAKSDSKDPAFWISIGRVAQEVWPLADGEKRKEHLAKVNAIMEKALQTGSAAKDEGAELSVADYFILTAQLDKSLGICRSVADRTGSIEASRRLVRLYDALEKPDESLKALEELVKTHPEDVEHRRMLSGVYFQRSLKELQANQLEPAQKHRLLAVDNLEIALQTGGGDMQDYLQVCALMRFTKDTDRFRRFSQRAAQLFPQEPRILFFAGVAMIYDKKYQEAAKLFDRASTLAESSAPERLDHDFFFQHGIALERSGGLDEAAKKFEKSIQLTPQENPEVAAQAMNYLGYMWAEKGQHLEQANELIRKANELRPSTPSYIDSLGWVLYQQGKYDEALTELLRAESLQESWEPDDAEMLEHTAQTYEKLNNKAKAEEYWRRTLDLKPTNEAVRQRAERALGIKPAPKSSEATEDK
jgi:tetratricopeptide (TPR) repeat protein